MLFQHVLAQDSTPEASPAGSGEVIRSITREEAQTRLDEAFAWEEPQNQGGTIIHTLTYDIKTLNPLLRTDIFSGWITGFVFNSLVGRSLVDAQPAPTALADSWEIAEDGVTYTVKLHEGVKWHDGEDFTADDVIFTYDSAMAEDSLSTSKTTLDTAIASYEKIDDYTIVFVSREQNAVFLQEGLSLSIIPKHIWENVDRPVWGSDPGATGTDPSRVIGTGPFKFVEWELGDHVTLEKNADYWDEANIPIIDNYIYKVTGEATTAISELQTGETDVIQVPFTQAKSLRQSNPELQVVDYDTYEVGYYYANQTEENGGLFTDVNVRQALQYALDSDLIAESVFDGFAVRAYGPQPVLSIAYDPSRINTIYDFDPDKARELLEEAGWTEGDDGIRVKDGTRFSFECIYSNGDPTYEVQIPYMQQAWRDIGVEMLPSTFPIGTIFDRFNAADFQLGVMSFAWGSTGSQEYMFGCDYAPPHGFNQMRYCNPDYDALIVPSKTALVAEQRVDILIEMANIVNDDAAVGATVFRKSVVGGAPRVHNFFPTGISEIGWLTRAWVDAE